MTAAWTPEQDAQLLEYRTGSRPRPWRTFLPLGSHGKSACLRRLSFLTSDKPRPVAAQPARKAEAERDGLEWLVKKGRLNGRRYSAGLVYGGKFREADGPALKSSLDIVEGRGSTGPGLPDMGATTTDAKAWLFRIRFVVLRGQPDMITVLDAVCGTRQRLRDLTGGDGNRARELEAVLKVALDLIADHLETGA